MLRLWHGISSSPISSLYGAFGIGAIIAAQISRPFIKFSPLANTNLTENSTITASHIQLQIPYGCGTILATIATIGLFITQYYELTELKKFRQYQQQIKPMIVNQIENSITNTVDVVYFVRVQKIFFQNVIYKNKAIFIMFSQILLLCMVFASGYAFMILNYYLLTFFTKGPAKLEVNVFINVYTLFLCFFIFGRLLSAFVAFKINAFLFYCMVDVAAVISVGLFTLPFFNAKPIPIYIIMPIIGLVYGPLQPAGFMIASELLGNVKSVVVALFCMSNNLGATFSQISTGYLIDNFKPDSDWFLYTDATSIYIVPFLFLFYIVINFTVFIMILMIRKVTRQYIKTNTKYLTAK
jgi:hypothetical protein